MASDKYWSVQHAGLGWCIVIWKLRMETKNTNNSIIIFSKNALNINML